MFRVNQSKSLAQRVADSEIMSRISAFIERISATQRYSQQSDLVPIAVSPQSSDRADVAEIIRRRRRGRYGIAQVSDIKTTWY